MKKSSRTGRTVREIVEHHPELISEVWCRKVFRQLLNVLEKNYALQLPHRVITPDTVVVQDDGSLLLLPSLQGDPVAGIADDLTALARVVHYAITQEVVPTGPLRGRAPAGFSDSLVSAVDRCMAFDPARRPRTIGELRDILGIVVFRPASPARPAAPAATKLPVALHMARPRQAAPPGPMRRRDLAWAGAGFVCLAGAGLAVFAGLRGVPAPDRLALTPPASRDVPRARPDKQAPLADATETPSAGTPPASGAAEVVAAPVQADVDREQAENTAPKPAGKDRTVIGRPHASAEPPPAPAPPAAAPAPAPAAADSGATFTLHIQPWGKVYVDGVERGISPPVKQLVLTPGRHAVLVTNPGARERVLEVDTARGDGRIAVDFENGP